MKLDATDIADLAPVIREAARAAIDELQGAEARLDGQRLGYPEAEAAALLGLPQHVLRDARRRGELKARRVGKKFVYSRAALVASS